MTPIEATTLNIYLGPCNPQSPSAHLKKYLILHQMCSLDYRPLNQWILVTTRSTIAQASSRLPAHSADMWISDGRVPGPHVFLSVADRYRHPRLGTAARKSSRNPFRRVHN